jgi:hypothetical protein
VQMPYASNSFVVRRPGLVLAAVRQDKESVRLSEVMLRSLLSCGAAAARSLG